MLLMACVFLAFASVLCCLVVTCCERGDLLALVCFCHFSMWNPGSGVILDCIDSLSWPPLLL